MMTVPKEGLDINEAFDNLLFGEEIAEKSGYEEGYRAGRKQLLEAYHLGYHKASQLAAELGYYSGVLECYLNSSSSSEKTKQLAKKLQEEINNFPKFNDEAVDILNALEDIKLKYRRFCSLAKLNSSYPEADKLDF